MPTISICIPTYNRSKYLAELLDSIVSQDRDDLEVVVFDDASPDETVAVANGYRDRLKNFRFFRQDQNVGIDRNFLSVVDKATGEYIWLMGDDDKLEPEGLDRVLKCLERWPNISGLTAGVVDYNADFTALTGVRGMPPTQRLAGLENVFCTMIEVLGFMSALVVRRDRWLSVALEQDTLEFQNYYIQVYIIGQIIRRFGDWGVLQEACVGFRSGNDQFIVKLGWLERLKVDVVAYEQIAGVLFGIGSSAFRDVQRRVFKCHVIARLLNAKTAPGPTRGSWRAFRLLLSHYRNLQLFWVLGVPLLLAPDALLRSARKIYKSLPRLSGAERARRFEAAIQHRVIQPLD